MRTRIIFLNLLVCLLIILPQNIRASEPEPQILTMEELSIQLMPEYSYHPEDKEKDQPPLLIGLHGTLMNKTDQPQKGKIEIPLPLKAAGFQIGFVADYSRDQSEMNEIEYEIHKDKSSISWTTSEEIQPGELYKFVVEYYSDVMEANKKDRSLNYKFESFTDIGLVRILFLEPLEAENFRLTPASDSHQENGYGMNMFMYQIQGMKANETKEIQLQYKRTETKTTMEMMNEIGGKEASQDVLKENKPPSIGVMVGGVGGISGAMAVVLVIFLKKREKNKPKQNADAEKVSPANEYEINRKQLRGKLLQGEITEEQYQELLANMVKKE